MKLPTDGCTDGYNLLTASIELTDGNPDNNRIEAQLPCYATAYPRKSLIEHFTTLPCVNCPYGLNVLRGLVSGRTDYVWVAHHVGYMTDELTVNDSYKVSSIVGVNGAPMACFDRTVLPGLSSNTAAAFSIGYTNPAYGKEALSPYLDQCTSIPAFVSVNLNCTFDTATKFDEITYDEVLARGLRVMDITATAMCRENNLPIYVFNMDVYGNLLKVLAGEDIGTFVHA